jgi:acetylornithine deacetylase/succinyl-diaminopimelate desuccinylase-like protein
VRGLSSAFVGTGARTIIPDRAVASIDMRLVKETPAASIQRKFQNHVETQGYYVVRNREATDDERRQHARVARVDFRDGTNAYRTPLGDPLAATLTRSLRDALGAEPVRIRTSGGTLPIAPFIQALGFPAVSVPIVNFDNNQHAENENLRVGHFWRGIEIVAAVMASSLQNR